jgi:hypothetical protein
LDSFYPPWDSRGEIYIKFGKPDNREKISSGWEEWTYYKHKLIFMVSNHMPNYHNRGIVLSSLSRYLYRSKPRYFDFVNRPQFYFSYEDLQNQKSFHDMDLEITSAKQINNQIHILYSYRFPFLNLRIIEENNRMKGDYNLRWVLYNEDYKVLKSSDTLESYSIPDNFSPSKAWVENTIHLELDPGSYTLGLRVKDIRANRIGIKKKHFRIRQTGSVKEFQNHPLN